MTDRWRALIERYLASVVERRPILTAAAAPFIDSAPATGAWWREEAFSTLRHEAHKLAGSSGSVGFAALGRQAAALDVLAQGIADDVQGRGPAGRVMEPGPLHAAQLGLLARGLLAALESLRLEDSSLLTPRDGDGAPGFPDGRLHQVVVIGIDAAFRRLLEYVATTDGWLVAVAAAPEALPPGPSPDLAVLLPAAGQPLEAWQEAFPAPVAVLTLPLFGALWPARPDALAVLLRQRAGLVPPRSDAAGPP